MPVPADFPHFPHRPDRNFFAQIVFSTGLSPGRSALMVVATSVEAVSRTSLSPPYIGGGWSMGSPLARY